MRVFEIQNALRELASNNNPHPFLNLIKTLIEKDLSLRDAQKFDEKHLKMLIIPYLTLSASHYVVSEPEWDAGYPDIVFLKRPNINTRHNFILELKYIKKADTNKIVISPEGTKEKLIQLKQREAKTQLEQYLKTDHANRLTNLKAWIIILVGREWKITQEIPL